MPFVTLIPPFTLTDTKPVNSNTKTALFWSCSPKRFKAPFTRIQIKNTRFQKRPGFVWTWALIVSAQIRTSITLFNIFFLATTIHVPFNSNCVHWPRAIVIRSFLVALGLFFLDHKRIWKRQLKKWKGSKDLFYQGELPQVSCFGWKSPNRTSARQ